MPDRIELMFSEIGSAAGGVDVTNFGRNAAWADYDGDGDLDLFHNVADGGYPDTLFENDGSGSFTEVGTSTGVDTTGQSYGSAWCVALANWDVASSDVASDCGIFPCQPPREASRKL